MVAGVATLFELIAPECWARPVYKEVDDPITVGIFGKEDIPRAVLRKWGLSMFSLLTEERAAILCESEPICCARFALSTVEADFTKDTSSDTIVASILNGASVNFVLPRASLDKYNCRIEAGNGSSGGWQKWNVGKESKVPPFTFNDDPGKIFWYPDWGTAEYSSTGSTVALNVCGAGKLSKEFWTKYAKRSALTAGAWPRGVAKCCGGGCNWICAPTASPTPLERQSCVDP